MSVEFDENLFFLGNVCKRGHRWEDTEKNLRYLKSKQCVQCVKSRDKLNPKRRSSHERKPELRKACQKRYREKHVEVMRERYRVSSRQRRFRPRFKEWIAKYRIAYAATLSGRAVLRDRNRRRRARKKGVYQVPWKAQELAARFELFLNKCVYCGAPPPLQADHFYSLASGGADCLGNIVPACSHCNASKGSKDAQDWYKECSFYDHQRWLRLLAVLGIEASSYGQFSLF